MHTSRATADSNAPLAADCANTEETAGQGKLRIAQVGLGYWGPNLLRNICLNQRADLIGVCDTEVSVLAEIVRRHSPRYVTSSFDDLLADTNVDAVVIATPTSLHGRHAMASLDAGKHVFLEKPMTDSLDDALALARRARDKGLCLMVGAWPA